MPYIKDEQTNITTVGELIESLNRFPKEMSVATTFDEPVRVYREEFITNEIPFPRSSIRVEG